MNDAIQNPEAQRLAQMLQQQQMQKLYQGFQGAPLNVDANSQQITPQSMYDGSGQMQQTNQMPNNMPSNNYGMPINKPQTMSSMPTRRGMLQSSVNDLELSDPMANPNNNAISKLPR